MRAFLVFTIVVLFMSGCETSRTTMDTPPPTKPSAAVMDISPAAAAPKTQEAYAQFVDVRTAFEYKAEHADRAINIPLEELEANLDRIEKNEPVYIICETSRRSREAAEILVSKGYPMVYNIEGGMTAWRAEKLPMAKAAAN
ncbi:MAG: rhodanese-like domain-containing protein [Acidobacteria bacterium]|nr:rhodanese-like domain-containing protein [Acidobacteriota bacterium]